MNYIELINKFWIADIEKSFTPSDTRLYFYLLHTCNKLAWKIPFGQSDRHLSMMLGMTVLTVREAKNRLKQRGLIDFKVPEKASKGLEGQTKYSFPSVIPSVLKNNTDGNTDTITDGITDGITNNKLNKTKQKKKIQKENFDCDFEKILIDGFDCDRQHVADWIKVRKEKHAANTESFLNAFVLECQKNGFSIREAVKICAEKSWQNFECGWVNDKKGTNKKLYTYDDVVRISGKFPSPDFELCVVDNERYWIKKE